jgi:hypothetical protein
MLSPREPRKVLLPEDHKLIEILGCTESEYRWYLRKRSSTVHFRPGEPTAFTFIGFVVTLVIGVALNYVASLLAPQKRSGGKPASIESKTVDGQDIVRSGRFAPTAGFNSPQNVVELGSIVPIVFAKREVIDNVAYGGIRVNTNLLWSQMYSLGSGQLLRAIFMIGCSGIRQVDFRQLAIGDNLISQYEIDLPDNQAGRISLYFKNTGLGRLNSGDHVAGRLAAYDEGNAQNSGGADVFRIRSTGNAWSSDFCYVTKPSNQTAFGLFATCGNALGYKVNPFISPERTMGFVPEGDDGDQRVQCPIEPQVKVTREKMQAEFSCRAGMVRINNNNTTHGQEITLNVGDTLYYNIENSSDYDLEFYYNNPGNGDGKVNCNDVAQAIAGRQRAWDDSLVVGELYKFGQALLVCIAKDPDDGIFISDADNDPAGNGVASRGIFRVVQVFSQRIARFTSLTKIRSDGDDDEDFYNGTQTSHLHRCAVASFVVDRPTQVVEIGIKSRLGIRYSGLCNFRDAKSFSFTDDEACLKYEDSIVRRGRILTPTLHTSGSYTGPEVRYSFFRIGRRIAGSDDEWNFFRHTFGIRSQTQEATYNYVRLEFDSTQRWEVMLLPVSGWEIREGLYENTLPILDAKFGGGTKSVSDGSTVARFSGEIIERNRKLFQLIPTIPKAGNLGLGDRDEQSYVDGWGKLAEIFKYEEVQASTQEPEHEIAYINVQSRNIETPLYNDLTLLGMNIRSGPTMTELSQVSVYVTQGYTPSSIIAGEHLFPACAEIILTDPVFGTGELVAPSMIDTASFLYCNTWTFNRRYFFDIAISNPENAPSKLSEWAGYFLLDLMRRGGRYYLEPIAEFGKIYSPVALYTAGNINLIEPDDPTSDSTLEVTYRELSERQPVIVAVKWREERASGDAFRRGLFPVVRQLNVRAAGTSENAPLVTLDLSDFCTSELHALDVAKMEIRKRLITHDVRLECIPEQAPLQPGAIIKLGIETLTYDSPVNGAILADGSVVFNGTQGDGTYEVALWDGQGDDLQYVTLEVVNGAVSGYSNSVFSVVQSEAAQQLYKVQKLDFTDNGDLEVIASHFPVEDDGMSSLLVDWNSPEAWVIEGLIGPPPADVPINQTFESVTIAGINTIELNEISTFSANILGPDGAYTYSWSCSSAIVNSAASPTCSIQFNTVGTRTVAVNVIGPGGVTRTDTHTVVVLAPAFTNVFVTGPTTIAVGGSDIYTSSIEGPSGGYSYQWTATPGVVISSPTSASTTITFASLTAGVTAMITLTVTSSTGQVQSTQYFVTVGALSNDITYVQSVASGVTNDVQAVIDGETTDVYKVP